MSLDRVVLATGNRGKLSEMTALLSPLQVTVVAQGELGVVPPEETGTTFAENALLKARYAARQTGLPAIADDSGIVVPALGGAPGVYSARYAGLHASDAENVDKLLAALEGRKDRAAYFHCAAVFVTAHDDAGPMQVEASWHGEISSSRAGSGGFGYDPVFFVPELGVTSAELSPEEKNARSHRGQAVRELADQLHARFGNA